MQESHYPSLTEESAIATFVYDITDNKIIYKNKAFSTLFKTEKEELLINNIKEIIFPDDYEYALECFSNLLKGKLDEQVQLRVVIQDEKPHWLRILPSIYTDSKHKKFIYGHLIDIDADLTNRHTFEKYANKKNSILNILGHELAGSLSIVNTLSTSLKSDDLSALQNQHIDHIVELNRQALELIRDLVNREFLETAEVVLSRKRVDIARKLREYLEEAQKAERNIKRTFNFFSSSDTIFINIDEPKFMQIFNNLISNALKFTNENGIINFKLEDKGDSVLFTISDNGIGIPKKFHPILFDQYTEAGRKGLQGEPSMGLGMNVIKNIIEWHGGKIWFDSEEGVGTIFYLDIPRS